MGRVLKIILLAQNAAAQLEALFPVPQEFWEMRLQLAVFHHPSRAKCYSNLCCDLVQQTDFPACLVCTAHREPRYFDVGSLVVRVRC